MTIWWCEEHENAGNDMHCKDAMFNSNFGPEDGPCRMVEMRLVPLTSVTIEGVKPLP